MNIIKYLTYYNILYPNIYQGAHITYTHLIKYHMPPQPRYISIKYPTHYTDHISNKHL